MKAVKGKSCHTLDIVSYLIFTFPIKSRFGTLSSNESGEIWYMVAVSAVYFVFGGTVVIPVISMKEPQCLWC